MALRGSRTDRRNRGLRRRELFTSGAGALAGAAVGAAGSTGLGPAMADAAALSPGGDPIGPSVNGYVKEVGGDTLILERYHLDLSSPPPGASLPSGPQLEVKIAPDAKLWRVGPAALSEFQRGDQLIAYVNWQDTALVAWGVEPLYQWVEAIVDSRSGGRLQTSKGTVVINEHTIMSPTANGSVKSLAALGKGNRIAANCMLDPASGDLIAGMIGAP